MKPEKERKKERGKSRQEQTHPRARSAKPREHQGLFGAGRLLCLPQVQVHAGSPEAQPPFSSPAPACPSRLALKLALRGVTLSFEFLKGLQRQYPVCFGLNPSPSPACRAWRDLLPSAISSSVAMDPLHSFKWPGSGPLLHCWWECKSVQPLWKTGWVFLRKLKTELSYDPPVLLLGIYPDKTIIQKGHAPLCSEQRYSQ